MYFWIAALAAAVLAVGAQRISFTNTSSSQLVPLPRFFPAFLGDHSLAASSLAATKSTGGDGDVSVLPVNNLPQSLPSSTSSLPFVVATTPPSLSLNLNDDTLRTSGGSPSASLTSVAAPSLSTTGITVPEEKPKFIIEPNSAQPNTALDIRYTLSMSFVRFKVNFTDLSSAADGIPVGPPISHFLSENPFVISNLLPGHQYKFEIYGFRKDNDAPQFLDGQVAITEPYPPSNFSVKEKGSRYFLLNWLSPPNSSLDFFHLNYQDISSGNTTDVHEISSSETSLKVTKNIFPGGTYQLTLYSTKGSRSSSAASFVVTSRPLPPINVTIVPNYQERRFAVLLFLHSFEFNVYSHCRLEVTLSESRQIVLNETLPVTSGVTCEFAPNLVPGELYVFRAWTVIRYRPSSVLNGGKNLEDTLSHEFKQETYVSPVYSSEHFKTKVVALADSLRIMWSDSVLSFWNELVGPNGNLSARLRDASSEFPIESLMVSPFGSHAGETGLTFEDLTAGTCYLLEVYTTVSGVVTDNRSRSQVPIRTKPAVASVKERQITSTVAELLVQFSASSHSTALLSENDTDASGGSIPAIPIDKSCRLLLQVFNASECQILSWTYDSLSTSSRPLVLSIPELLPFRKYRLSGVQECGAPSGLHCAPERVELEAFSFQTLEGLPSAVRNVRCQALIPSSALIEWDPPLEVNGRLQLYLITVYPEVTSLQFPWNITVLPSIPSYSVGNLTGGILYRFEVRAKTSVGYSNTFGDHGPDSISGQSASSVRMKIGKPPNPIGKPVADQATAQSHSFTVTYSLKIFNTQNGYILKFAVIVAEGEIPLSEQNTNLSWQDVQKYDIWPPYVAYVSTLTPAKDLDIALAFFVVGSDKECRQLRNGFCNGAVRPDRKYRVKLRAYTSDEFFSDTDYSELIVTESEHNSSAGVVIAVVVVVVLLMVLLLCITLFLRNRSTENLYWLKGLKQRGTAAATAAGGLLARRTASNALAGRSNGLAPNSRVENILDARLERVHHLPPVPTVLPTADRERSRPVKKCDFAEHVRLMSADTDLRFSEEYEDLKQVGRNQLYTAAELPSNRAKNRFTNILPFDHSRVKLSSMDDDECSDYINANYVPGANSKREYIAAQGPLPSTRDDFWRMIWQTQAHAIVNLTKCIEKGREKCDQYWPTDTSPVFYGDIQVTLMNETKTGDLWTIREFRVTLGCNVRTVRHFHFTAWPDFGVPERPQALLKFIRTFRSKITKEMSPIVVHCSAGVGRSGTWMAVDMLLQMLESTDFIDIYGLVYQMREYRVLMVQTELQYIFVHQCLLCALEGNEDEFANYSLPFAQIHENPVFEDDEGIAESGF